MEDNPPLEFEWYRVVLVVQVVFTLIHFPIGFHLFQKRRRLYPISGRDFSLVIASSVRARRRFCCAMFVLRSNLGVKSNAKAEQRNKTTAAVSSMQ